MNLRRTLARLVHVLFRNNTLAARILGVRFSDGCKFIGNPIEMFGSEPWAISIGKHVEIANGVQIITHDGALWVARSLDETLRKSDSIKKVRIGNNVFIGTNSVILGGVTVGDNVIIGANSVVNKDIPSDCVAVGSPCLPIKPIKAYMESVKSCEQILNTKGLSPRKKQKEWEKVL